MELLNFDLSRSLLHPKLIDQLSVFDIVYFFGASDRPMVKICEEIEYIRLPVVDEKADRKISIEKFPIVHPHRILSYLFDVVGIQLDDADIEHFWNHSRAMKEPWAIDHPASPQHVPLGLHGDGARLWTVYRVEKMVGVYMNIIHFRPLSVRHSRFLLFSIPREKLLKNRTMNVVWRRLVWSFNAAFEGINPTTGVGGGPLTGADLKRAGEPLTRSGKRFSLVELRGDWEWHRDVWRFTASWQGIQVCFRCPAVAKSADGDDAYLYHNNGPSNRCHSEEFNLQQFVARRLKENQLCFLDWNWKQCVLLGHLDTPLPKSTNPDGKHSCFVLCQIHQIWFRYILSV